MNRETKRRKQIAHLQKIQAKPDYKAYPFILFLMIVLVHLLDTYVTDVCTKVQSLYVNDFFVVGKGMTFESGLQRATIITTVGYVFTVIGPFYKALMDKVGRKPIFVINTAGMALGLLLCFFSPNFIVFALGQLCIVFFAMHDMQMLYIYEVAPAKWRSTLYFTCKFLGVFGTVAIPFMRDRYVQPDGSGWKNVFLLPAILGFAVFLFAAILMRESPIFLETRLKTLTDRKTAAKTEEKQVKTGIFPAIKYIFTHKQLKWLAVSIVCISTSAYAVSMYYESYLSTAYSTEQVTRALYFQTVAMSVLYLIAGLLSDKLGRKTASCIFSFTTLAGFVAFLICVQKGVSPTVAGILLGAYLGSLWDVTDLNALMFGESAPTEIRGSVMGAQVLLYGVGTAISLVLCMVLLSFLSIQTVMLTLGVPGLVLGSVFILTKLKETKGVSLSEIQYQ